ncbi:starch-binding protein [uncultured Treponema sp.]|uniref:starch-binding protein n=1 Tax=uncultured Treponema sp. TaxID=162155 RepID=UPI0025F2D834|nr:starch-binding protein [uncultured Treponema sp.]
MLKIKLLKSKRIFFTTFASLALIFSSCSDFGESGAEREKSESYVQYGSLVIKGAECAGRAIDVSEISSVTVSVSGSGMTATTPKTFESISSGAGVVSIENIPVGDNRVVTVESNVDGAVIRALVDIKAGIANECSVTWGTTAVANIFYNLINANVDVSSINKGVFESVIPSDCHASLVDVAKIAGDYQKVLSETGTFDLASSYKLSTGTVNATVYGYSGKSVQIADPSSVARTAGADGSTLIFDDVLLGKWNVYADGEKVKTITVVSGENDLTIGSSISGKVIVFANDSVKKTFYIWKNGTQSAYSAGWPGTSATAATDDMMNNPDGWYYVDITDKYDGGSINLILNNNGSNQTDDIKTGKTATFWYDAAGTCGTAGAFYDSDPTENQLSNDTTLTSIAVNGKSASISGTTASISMTGTDDSLSITNIVASAADSSATVTYSATTGTVADGESAEFTITVTNGSKTAIYTLTVSYTKRAPNQGQYGTNDKGYGVNKTIASWSDWSEDMQIARGAAYDDPRTWMGIQESPYDAYALYAAYDDTNLYLMVELTNLPDGRATFMNHNYAGSDNAWWDNRDCPLGFIINTGKGATANAPLVGSASGKPIWDAINFTDSEGFDFLFYGSSKYGYAEHKAAFVGVGTPGLFKLNPSTGYFSYDKDYCLSANSGAPGAETAGTSGISVRYNRKCQVSSKVKFESTPTGNRAESNQTGEDLLESENYTEVDTNDLDMSYWYTIPLATLGIDKAYILSNGIGVRQLTPNGGSLMDCLPWDVSMVDNATEPCSDDESTSHEKEDVDQITSAQARIGK